MESVERPIGSRKRGPAPKLSPERELLLVKAYTEETDRKPEDIAEDFGVSRTKLYMIVAKHKKLAEAKEKELAKTGVAPLSGPAESAEPSAAARTCGA